MKKTSYLLIVALLLANILVGCSTQPESVTGPDACEVDVGSTLPLTFTVLPEDVEDKTLAFVSSDETILTVDETGNALGLAPGSATVTATAANGVTAEVLVTVTQPVESVSAEESLTLDIGLTGCVNAQIQPQEATDSTLSYSSDDEEIATVDEAGVVTALAAGEATITITAHNGQQAKTIIVVETPVLEVAFDQESASIYIGETQTLTATVLPEDATHADLVWDSSDETVATVDDAGLVSALALGKTTITATAQNGVSVSCTVTVAKKPATSGNTGGSDSTGNSGSSGNDTGSGSTGSGGNTDSNADGSSPGGGTETPSQLTQDQISAAIGEAQGYAGGYGFQIVGDRQPSHSVGVTAYYDYGAFLGNLKSAVDHVASLFSGEDLSLVKVCIVQDGNTVYVTYG